MAVVEHKILGDQRGKLVALESSINVPFEIKRVFYIYGTQPGVPRGQHSHFETKQYLIAVNGSCKVTLDNGSAKETFLLNSPNMALFQDAMTWGEMHDFSSDCVLLVLASDYYDESDYIRNYDDFLLEVSK
ncbi:dTDP-6-deoxy-3,4-keto-hexulose isomerase [Comamonas phosphati]|nr:dTDP-6-deoxy-3,4-keto-hexulose isomerase [Comamonas phosphati]